MAIAFLAAAIMGLELVQVRILSSLYYNQIVYFTVTIALMGFGLAGVVLSLMSHRGTPPFHWIMQFTALFGVSSLLCLSYVSHIPVWYPHQSQLSQTANLILVVPFFCGGMAVGLLLLSYGAHVQKLYAADLVASAAGAVLVMLLLRPLGAPTLLWLCSLMACISLVLQASFAPRWQWHALGFAVCIALAFAVVGNRLINYWPGQYKELGSLVAKAAEQNLPPPIEAQVWTPIARIDISTTGERKLLTQDGLAPSGMLSPVEVDEALMHHVMDTVGAVSLPLLYQMNTKNRNVLIIGTGGGADIVRARAFTTTDHIQAVEVNAATYDLMMGKFANFLKWPHWSDVKAYRAEGRNFVRQHPGSFDKITMSGIDTYAASNAGAYILTENYLYTVEAMQDYLRALKPDGIMVSMRWLTYPVAREAIRMSSNFIEAAKREGIANPEKCIFVTAEDSGYPGRFWGVTFVKKTPFTPQEITVALKSLWKKPAAVVYLPKLFDPKLQLKLEEWVNSFYQPQLASVRATYKRLLNAPSEDERVKLLERYPYDIGPSFDDSPFFFQDIKMSDTLAAPGSICPVCQLRHWLVMSTVVSAVGMVVPLLMFNASGLLVAGAPFLLLYFASLGLGFIMVEVGLMQRLSFYLGDPMYSLAIILGSLLFSAGVGSYLRSRLKVTPEKLMRLGTLAPVVLLGLWLLAVPPLMSATALFEFWARALLVIVTLLPFGVVMGVPFAAGLAHVQGINPRFIPWAWGVNGLTSVLASVLSVILAMKIGFTHVLMLGWLVYVIGFIAAMLYGRCIRAL